MVLLTRTASLNRSEVALLPGIGHWQWLLWTGPFSNIPEVPAKWLAPIASSVYDSESCQLRPRQALASMLNNDGHLYRIGNRNSNGRKRPRPEWSGSGHGCRSVVL
jgi:hypothetical protein